MENNGLIKYEGGLIKHVANALSITNKLLEESAAIHLANGLKRISLKEYEEAILYFTKAIELKPYYAIAYYYRSGAKSFLKKYDDALMDINIAIEFEPENINGHAFKFYLLGSKFYYAENFADAKKHLLKAIELNIDFNNAYIELIFLYVRIKELQNALILIQKSISIFPNNAMFYLISGEIKGELMEKYSEAIEDFTKGIAVERQNSDYSDLLKEIYLKRSEAKKEIGDIEGSSRDTHIRNSLITASRIQNEGLNDDEKRLYGLI